MIFLWGTPVTEPFHIFVRYINKITLYAAGRLGLSAIVTALGVFLLVIALTFVLQKLTSTAFGIYIPVAIAVFCLVLFVGRTAVKSNVKVNDAVALIIPAAILLILYLIKAETVLTWVSDIYVYSLPVALLTATLFVPIGNLGSLIGKIMYVTKYNELNIVGPFAGLFGVPAIVWGIFFAIIAMCPVVYNALGGKKA